MLLPGLKISIRRINIILDYNVAIFEKIIEYLVNSLLITQKKTTLLS